jgi:hypothetical protein
MKHAREDYQRFQDPAGVVPKDEPVFLIRGQDKVGAATVRIWAELNDAAGGDPELSRRAREHAERMDRWPKKKIADLQMGGPT